MTTTDWTHRTGPRSLFVILPAATFLVGLLLGAVLVGVAEDDGAQPSSPAASPAATPASPSGSAGQGVLIEESCLRAAQRSGEMVELVREVVEALRDLDTQRTLDIIDELERLDMEVREAASRCEVGPAR